MSIKTFEIQYLSSQIIAHGIKHIKFKRTDELPFDFIPGQFITFILNKEKRSYSIANTETGSEIIEIDISYINGGIASEILCNTASYGDKFKVIGPVGKLILKKREKIRKLVLAGTGTGITPYRSMMKQIIESINNNYIKQLNIILGAQSQKQAIYSEYFRKYANKYKNINFKICLSRQKDKLNEDETTGYIQDQFNMLNLDSNLDIVYLCGNPNMIDDALIKLNQLKFNSNSIRKEKYTVSRYKK